MATLFSAHRDLTDAAHRREMARLWGLLPDAALPDRPGLTAVEMFEAAARGKIKALWIACTNPAQSMPDQAKVRQALSRAEFVIVQEAYQTAATCQWADVLFPRPPGARRRAGHQQRAAHQPGARGREGARSLARHQAFALMSDLLHGRVMDLELGAFCVAMRVKGETPRELAGFLDAIHASVRRVPDGVTPTVVLPSYNGARRLPLLTPLLALMLARQGCRVLVHGQTDDPTGRLTSHTVLRSVAKHGADVDFAQTAEAVADRPGVVWLSTGQLLPGLQRVLDGLTPCPAPLRQQVEWILELLARRANPKA